MLFVDAQQMSMIITSF